MSAGLYRPSRSYRREAVRQAIRELYPDGIAVPADERYRAINGWLKSHSIPKVSRKTIQRAMELTALEPQGVWEGDELRPRLRTHRGAVVTYHPRTQRLQFQGRHGAAIDLRDRFLALIGRARS